MNNISSSSSSAPNMNESDAASLNASGTATPIKPKVGDAGTPSRYVKLASEPHHFSYANRLPQFTRLTADQYGKLSDAELKQAWRDRHTYGFVKKEPTNASIKQVASEKNSFKKEDENILEQDSGSHSSGATTSDLTDELEAEGEESVATSQLEEHSLRISSSSGTDEADDSVFEEIDLNTPHEASQRTGFAAELPSSSNTSAVKPAKGAGEFVKDVVLCRVQ